MATKITRDILESYLNCKYKGYLKLTGESGIQSDYETMTTAARASSREQAIVRLIACFGEGVAYREKTITTKTLQQGAPLLVDAQLEDAAMLLRFDTLKRTDGGSQLGEHNYVPVLHNHGDKVGRRTKLLLAMLSVLLGHVQGLRSITGLVARGPEGRLGKVRLDAKLYRHAEQVLDEVKALQGGGEPPRLMLNGHCKVCESRQRCRRQAEEANDISLLGGVGEKEMRQFHRKGLFTLTQLSCTFRPRKRRKRVKQPSSIHYSSLQALAIREKKIHVYGTPNLPRKPVQVFLDAEGNESDSFAYLVGVLLVAGDTSAFHSLWADDADQEVGLFDAFLDLLAGHEDFTLFHYGSYEKTLLKRMRKVVQRKNLVDRLLGNAVNVLSVIHSNVYFPTFSNGLKEVGRYLGCTWTQENASGLQSLVWRARWEESRNPTWKDKLNTYNAEDCVALEEVTECVQRIDTAARYRGDGARVAGTGPEIAWADQAAPSSSRRGWGRACFALADFDAINQCAYFDYQREKVFIRTSKAVRRACLLHGKRRMRPPANREMDLQDALCPYCRGTRITPLPQKTCGKVAFDLEFTRGGIRRRVIRCKAAWQRCEDCERRFPPERYTRRDKHLHGLKSWAMYQDVVHRISLKQLGVMFEDCFDLRVAWQELQAIRALMANRYRKTGERILARIVTGRLVHADETDATL